MTEDSLLLRMSAGLQLTASSNSDFGFIQMIVDIVEFCRDIKKVSDDFVKEQNLPKKVNAKV